MIKFNITFSIISFLFISTQLLGFGLTYYTDPNFSKIEDIYSTEKEKPKEKIFYISPKGSDSNNGTKNHPFATLERAKLAINENKGKSVIIYLREGVYQLDNTFVLENGDIPENTPILISSFPGEKAHIIGGREISGFTELNSNSKIAKKIDSKFHKDIFTIDLKAIGITNFGKLSARGMGRPIESSGLELYFDEKPMTLARWPNKEWTTIKDIPEFLDGKGFSYAGDRPEKWVDAPDLWLHGYWKYDWADTYVKVSKIDIAQKTIETEAPYSGYPFAEGKRFYALNLLEELDSPGEWYLDRESGILYFWPPSDIQKAKVVVSLLQEPLVQIKNLNNVSFKGIIFEYSAGAGIEIIGGNSNTIDSCIVRNMGTIAVSIGKLEPNLSSLFHQNTLYNGDAGSHNGVINCEIYATGEGGVILGGGDRATLKSGNNFAINNNIYDCSRTVRTYRAGIYMYGVGNIVQHNRIHDLPHTAIFFWGNEHLMEYNEVYQVCMETGDAGAFYNGRDWSQRGSIIRYNYIHHLHGVEGQGGFTDVMAIYLDDWSSGATIFGNVFYKAGRTAMIGSGRDNLVENNIFIDGTPAIHVDSRGMGWASYYFDGSNETLFKRLKVVQPNKPPYSERYPNLVGIPNNNPALPIGNRIIKNISSGGIWKELLNKETEPLVYFSDNNTTIDKRFLLDKNDKIDIQYNAIDLPTGFKPIPFEKIGLLKVNE